jgi:hypothetical protein
MGGLFTRRYVLAGGVSILASRAFGAEKEPVGMQLILAADVSCSVNTERYAVQQQGYVRALQDSRVMQAIRNLDPPVLGITFVVWAGNQTTLVQWMRVHDPQSMGAFCAALQASRRQPPKSSSSSSRTHTGRSPIAVPSGWRRDTPSRS